MLGQTNVKVKPKKRIIIDYVDYIESTGTQYIDTGVIVTGTTGFSIDMEYYAGTRILGVANTSWSRGIVVTHEGSCYRNGSYNAIDFTGDTSIFTIGERVSFSLINNEYTDIHGNTGSMVSTSFTSNGTLALFALRYNGSIETNTMASIKLRNFKVYDGNTVTRDYKPVKDGAGVYCLYDEFEKRYYYNQGSGEFLGGASI